MSKSTARFTKNGNISSRMSFAGGGQAGAKKGGQAAASEGAGGRSTLQVIFNGKIVTPQSLLSRKAPASGAGSASEGPRRSSSWAPKDSQLEGSTTVSMMIEETEFPEKSAIGKAKSKTDQAELLRAGRLQAGISVQPSVGAKKGVEHDEAVIVLLRETATETVLSLPSFISASDMREVAAVEERNSRYEALVVSHRVADGGYVSRPTQTANNPQKNQNDMAAPSALRDFGVQVTAYEILDETSENSPDQQDEVGVNVGTGPGNGGIARRASVGVTMLVDEINDSSRLSESVKKFVADTVTLSLVTPGCLLDVNDLNRPPPPGESREQRLSTRVPRGVRTSMVATVSGNLAAGHSRQSNEDSDHGGGEGLRRRKSSRDRSGSVPAIPGATSGLTMVSQAGSRQQSREGSDGEGHWPTQELSEEETLQVLRDNEADGILSSKLLLKRLLMLERAVQQNAYHRQHLDYRDLPDVVPVMLRKSPKTALSETNVDHLNFGSSLVGGVGGGGAAGRRSILHNQVHSTQSQTDNTEGGFTPSGSVAGGHMGGMGMGTGSTSTAGEGQAGVGIETDNPKVKRLFRYYSEELVQGRAVTSMVWNALNCDLLAVGYGKIDTFVDNSKLGEEVDEQLHGGLVLFWSLRNPEHPEKIMRTTYPVVSLDFSKISPMLLAVGQSNGDVSVYDVKRETDWNVPLQTSTGMVGGHTDPVWQLKWVMKRTERFERFETLISISTDGSILEWTTKKGFAVSTLMQLKRAGMGEGWISRQAAGLSFDFAPSDPSTYVTGTEEGSLHRCSVSYNEQYLDTYEGHQGPIYKVKFSPRWHSVFLSCSADWTISVWHLHSKTPLLTLKASGEENAINDIAWCPDNSTIFAAVTADAKLQIWDLNVSSIDPVVAVDTSSDDVLVSRQDKYKAGQEDQEDQDKRGDLSSSPPTTPGISGSRSRQMLGKGSVHQSTPNAPVAHLLKNLSQSVPRRALTCLQFGEKSPTVVVGDNRGAVTVYRILDPITITHEGPVQQTTKLKQAIMRQSDPVSTARLRKSEGEEEARGMSQEVEVEINIPLKEKEAGPGPPSTNSACDSKRSQGVGDDYLDPPTNAEDEEDEEEGFAFSNKEGQAAAI